MSEVLLRNEDAYSELYRRHSSAVGATSRMILGVGPASDDVVADVFAGLWQAPEKFESERGSLLGFLRVKARGRSIDLVRNEVARRQREDRSARLAHLLVTDVSDELVSEVDQEQLKLALGSLVQREREAIELAFFEGMTYAEVAAHLGIAEGTAKSRIRSGLRRLRLCPEVQSCVDMDMDGSLRLAQQEVE